MECLEVNFGGKVDNWMFDHIDNVLIWVNGLSLKSARLLNGLVELDFD